MWAAVPQALRGPSTDPTPDPPTPVDAGEGLLDVDGQGRSRTLEAVQPLREELLPLLAPSDADRAWREPLRTQGDRCHAGAVPGATAVPVPRAARAARPPASTWLSAVAAIAVVAALAAAGRFVGGSLMGTCTGAASSCAQAEQWLERGYTAQLGLGAVGVLLLVATALRRARGVRRLAVLVILLAVVVFFGSTLLAARSV